MDLEAIKLRAKSSLLNGDKSVLLSNMGEMMRKTALASTARDGGELAGHVHRRRGQRNVAEVNDSGRAGSFTKLTVPGKLL